MKESLITIAIVLLAVAAQAQTAFKVHSDGQISLQSATTSYGIQIPSSGVASFEPNITAAYSIMNITKARAPLTRAWTLDNLNAVTVVDYQFFVLGNGSVYSFGGYYNYTSPFIYSKSSQPIEHATELISNMKGYYMDSHEFEGVTPEDFEDNPNVQPEAIEGLLKDLEKDKVIGMYAEELEEVLPEAVRHTPEGNMAINYNAIVPVLIEAFKEQQARIEQLESILSENGLLNRK
jgi:hypothetical protein